MIVLQQLSGQNRGRRVEFSRGPVLLGRSPDADLRFDAHADIDVSARHAVLELEDERWVIRDVGSRNGTFVGGKRIRERLLSDRDEIELGHGGPRLHVTLPSHVDSTLENADTEPERSHFEAPSAQAAWGPDSLGQSPEVETKVVSHEAETVVLSPEAETVALAPRGARASAAAAVTQREVPAMSPKHERTGKQPSSARLEESLARTRVALAVTVALLLVALALLLTR